VPRGYQCWADAIRRALVRGLLGEGSSKATSPAYAGPLSVGSGTVTTNSTTDKGVRP